MKTLINLPIQPLAPPATDTVLVIAPNYQQFSYYTKRWPPYNYVFIDNSIKARYYCSDQTVIAVGEYQNVPGLEELVLLYNIQIYEE